MASSKTAIYAAIAGNGAIAVTKFIAAAMTGSAAMMAEGIHSVVDTGNGGLLLLGIRRSRRPPDDNHPYGHGKDLYFWTLMVAMLIFGVGGGVSVYEGVQHLLHPPAELEDPTINYIVLGLALVFEGIAWTIALVAFLKLKGEQSIWGAVRESKDPTTFAVVFEDSAALFGILIALAGIVLADVFQNPVFDAAASIAIGVLLMVVALVLLIETKGLLLGESALPDVVEDIERIVDEQEGVRRSGRVLTMHLGPNEILVNLDVEFRDALTADDIETEVKSIQRAIRAVHPTATRIYVEPTAVRADGRSTERDADVDADADA